ncbi:MAG: hypothetical protein J6A83_07060 [Clostridia bacterium]|nr:hypothetical protein [Clostridia bacterium]
MKTKYLTVGTNFDISQLEYFIDCNERYDEVKIDKVYGSIRSEHIGLCSARPDFRLGTADKKDFEEYVRLALKHKIGIDYTANALLNMPIETLHEKESSIVDLFKYLESVGVERVIVANPLIMELITKHTSLSLKCSTILGINSVNAIKYYAQYRVDSICPDIYINRNIPLLSDMQQECQKYGINLELLANEVCMFGDVPCNNILRTNCYIHSSLGGNPQHYFDSWPFSRCQTARRESPSSILKIPFILPTHIERYRQETGISFFKISGRTNTFEYLTSTVEKYMSQTFEGPIENLFMLPQNKQHSVENSITVEQLTEQGFFEKIFNRSNPCNYQCHKCQYCDKLYEKFRV